MLTGYWWRWWSVNRCLKQFRRLFQIVNGCLEALWEALCTSLSADVFEKNGESFLNWTAYAKCLHLDYRLIAPTLPLVGLTFTQTLLMVGTLPTCAAGVYPGRKVRQIAFDLQIVELPSLRFH